MGQLHAGLGKEEIEEVLRFTIPSALMWHMIRQGNGYTASHRFEGVASDAYVDVLFANPSASGLIVRLGAVEVVSLAQAHVDIYRNVTVSSPGTPIVPVNLNLGSSNTSSMHVEYGGTYTVGTPTLTTVCPGGSKIRAVGGATEVGELALIPAGYNFLVRVTNASASSTDISVRILWCEGTCEP